INETELLQNLKNAYQTIKTDLQKRYILKNISDKLHQSYLGQYINQATKLFDNKIIDDHSGKLVGTLNDYYSSTINNGEYYKLMTKQDVEFVLNEALKNYNEEINIETQFYELIQLVSKSTWFQEWDYLKNI
ncbi:MAG: hypothetical protein ABL940_02505, partial [Bacteroidia bacterium]